MTMTVGDLISELQYYDENLEVRFASQPSWPFEYSVASVTCVNLSKDEDDEDTRPNDGDEEVVYLVEGDQLGYLPGAVRDHIGWGR